MHKIGEFFGLLGRVRSDITTIRKEMEDIVRDTDIHSVIKDNQAIWKQPTGKTANSKKPAQDSPAEKTKAPKPHNHRPLSDRQL